MTQYKAIKPAAIRTQEGDNSRVVANMRVGNVCTRISRRGKSAYMYVKFGKHGGYARMSNFEQVPSAPKPSVVSPKLRGRFFGRKFVNDIGHGVNNTRPHVYDSGATSGNWEEHKVVEEFVELLSNAEQAQDASVLVTHDQALLTRGPMAKRFGGDKTSWHANSGGGHGVEVWIPFYASFRSASKSALIGRTIATALHLPYRGTKRTLRLAVLRGGFDRLVELFFMDNPTDRKDWVSFRNSAVNAVLNVM